MESSHQECVFTIRRSVIIPSYQLVLAMFRAVWKHRKINTILFMLQEYPQRR